MAEVKDRIKQLRKELGLSKADMSKILGVSRSTITRYENGIMNPTIEMLLKMREEFGVTIDWLVGVDTVGEDKYIPAVKKCLEAGISPDDLMVIVDATAKIKKE